MDASLGRDLALGTTAVLVGGQLTWLGARLYVRAAKVHQRRARSVRRLIMVQFDLIVVGLLALVSVARVRVTGPAEHVLSRFGTAFLSLTLAHAMLLLYLVSRALFRDADPATYDGMLPTRPDALPEEQTPDGIPTVLMVLTGLSGVIDAASYLGMGRLFLGKMTGNVETIGWSAAGIPGVVFMTAAAALAVFLLGAVAAGRLSRRLRQHRRRWVAVALAVEAVLLLVALITAVTIQADFRTAGQFWLIEVLALAMGFRNGTTRKLAEPDMNTTLITGNLADLAADSALAGGHSRRQMRRLGVVVSMLVGAAIGGYLYAHDGLLAPLALAAAVSCALAAGYPLFLIARAAAEYLRPAAGLLRGWIEHQDDETRALERRVRRLEEVLSPDNNADR